MTPKILLSLWRERWGKADAGTYERPLISGTVDQWGDRLTQSVFWIVPGLSWIAVVLFLTLVLLLATIKFSLIDQWVLSLFLLLVSVLIRRYQGRWITLVLLGFVVVSSSRYLFWRFDQTLAATLSAEFLVGTALFAVELVYALIFVADSMLRLWPVMELQTKLPEDSAEWPKVGVFVVCANQSLENIELTLASTRALTWPKSKITLYFVDATDRDEVRQVVSSKDAGYKAYPNEKRGVPGIVNQAISESRDEIVVILSAGQVLPSNSLVSSLGWIDRDPILGMLSTAHHFLMPPPRDAFVKQFGTSGLDGEYMVLRRSMFVEVGGIPCEPLTLNSHIARSMNQVGLTHAYIAKILTIQNVAPLESTEVALCRLNNPFNARVFQWKLRADRYRSAIKSFQPLLRFVLVAIPLVYFLEHISPIKASAVVLLSYALPHFMQAYLFKDRLQKSGRPPLWIEIREIYLSIQMLLLTTLTVTLTKLNHVIEDLRGGKSATLGQSRWPLGAGDALLAIALCLAIISFILNEMQSVVVDRATDVLYAFWSGYVLMLLAARLAVAEEAQQIRLKKQIQLQMPAMVRLTNNRTFACSTTNFPKAHLQLLIPTELSLTPGIEVKVSVFHHFDEFAFQANVLSFGDSVLSIEIDKEFLDAYAAFANAAFARDEDWPKWLPDQDADQLVPAWVYKFPSWLSRNVMDLVRIFSKGRVNS